MHRIPSDLCTRYHFTVLVSAAALMEAGPQGPQGPQQGPAAATSTTGLGGPRPLALGPGDWRLGNHPTRFEKSPRHLRCSLLCLANRLAFGVCLPLNSTKSLLVSLASQNKRVDRRPPCLVLISLPKVLSSLQLSQAPPNRSPLLSARLASPHLTT